MLGAHLSKVTCLPLKIYKKFKYKYSHYNKKKGWWVTAVPMMKGTKEREKEREGKRENREEGGDCSSNNGRKSNFHHLG